MGKNQKSLFPIPRAALSKARTIPRAFQMSSCFHTRVLEALTTNEFRGFLLRVRNYAYRRMVHRAEAKQDYIFLIKMSGENL
jgi:hypothetical protein